ncbi:hypothetical protein NUSPORA_00068 [Nucleospora cyclopteri]
MPEIVGILLDNSLQSQNQDYLPSRIILQRDSINAVVSQLIQNHPENMVGIFPIAQRVKNNILTPTNLKQNLLNFLFRCDLETNVDHNLAFFQVDQALQLSEIKSKTLIVFLSSTIEEFGELLINITNIAIKGIEVKVICYGDAIEFGQIASSEIQMQNVKILVVEPTINFEESVFNLLRDDNQEEDAELLEVLEKSKYEK